MNGPDRRTLTGGSCCVSATKAPLASSPLTTPHRSGRPAVRLSTGDRSIHVPSMDRMAHRSLFWRIDRSTACRSLFWVIDRSTAHRSLFWRVYRSMACRCLFSAVYRSTAHRSLFSAIDRSTAHQCLFWPVDAYFRPSILISACRSISWTVQGEVGHRSVPCCGKAPPRRRRTSWRLDLAVALPGEAFLVDVQMLPIASILGKTSRVGKRIRRPVDAAPYREASALGLSGATTAYWYTVTHARGWHEPERQVFYAYGYPEIREIACLPDAVVLPLGPFRGRPANRCPWRESAGGSGMGRLPSP